MGTQLQRCGLKPGEKPEVFGMNHPDEVAAIQSRYISAGSDIIYANTFGVNSHKYAQTNYSVADVVSANIAIARRAAAAADHPVRVALDIGPIGELMQPLGTLSFDEAYDVFREIVCAGEKAGADLVVFETMTDLYEVKAGVLAAKENTSLPVWVTMTFEKSGRTFAGVTPAAMALTLDGLGVDAMGVNCSLGPSDLVPIVKEILEWTAKPVIVKPNAGLPDPRTGLYALTPERFARQMSVFPDLGIFILGGCCGTTPAFISALKERCGELISGISSNAADESKVPACSGIRKRSVRRGISSAGRTAELNGHILIVGERINPTGKKRFQQALREHDMNYVMKCAIEQTEAGADILDINVGLPGADEAALMRDVVRAVQSVTDLPLQIDSGTPEVIESGLRAVNGRAIVNSVNADRERCNAVLPIVRKYGACVVGLALKKSGMPSTAQERFENALSILKMCEEYGIPKEDIIIDCLALTISAQQNQAMETLHAIEKVHRELGVHCTLGVSNISFGLPERTCITQNFLSQAMFCGLDLPIVNPNNQSVMDTVASFRALSGEDEACAGYISRFSGRQAENAGIMPAGGDSSGSHLLSGTDLNNAGADSAIRKAVIGGLPEEVAAQTKLLLKTKTEMEVIEQDLIPALDAVGDRYEKQQIFLPQLIGAANAASAGFDLIKNRIAQSGGSSISQGTVLLATVEGDIHDIGKNIVKVVLENYGFTVLDLGRDVPVEKVRDEAVKNNIRLVGLSALMTTTLPSMERSIRAIRETGTDCRFVVGGAVVTPEYAAQIGADYYAKDAKATVDAAREVFAEKV